MKIKKDDPSKVIIIPRPPRNESPAPDANPSEESTASQPAPAEPVAVTPKVAAEEK